MLYFGDIFNKTIILLALVEYEIVYVIDNLTLLTCDQAIFLAENKNA